MAALVRRCSGGLQGKTRNRTIQAVMLAQSSPCVFIAKQAAPSQDRQHFIEEHWRHHVESIGSPAVEPLLNQIGDLHWRTDRHPMAASTRQAIDQLAQRRFLTVNDIDDQLETTGLALGTVEVDQMPWEWRIQILTGQVNTQHSL